MIGDILSLDYLVDGKVSGERLLKPHWDTRSMQHLRNTRIRRMGTKNVEDKPTTILPGLDSLKHFAQPFNETKELQCESLYVCRKGDDNARSSRQAMEAIKSVL